jgi:effector-binding domain-containing protein
VAAKGAFRDIYVGDALARHTTDMGPFGKMEKGVQGDVVWEVDPSMGAKVHRGDHAAVTRRYFAWMRGAPISGLYESAARAGSETIDGSECTVLRLQPKSGTPDLAYVDATGTVHRIDMALPTPESADATFDIDDAMLAQIAFADWTDVDGLALPKRRALRMGPATVSFECKDLRAGTQIEAAAFAPPAAIEKARKVPAAEPAFDADGKPTYQVVEREAQPVASIRVKCKPAEISQQLATILPEVMAHLTETGGKVAGAPFSRYHTFGDTEVDLEAGIPVQQPITAKGRVQNSELPGGKVVTTWHIGPYEQLTGAYEGLHRHLTAQKLTQRGAQWEVYWTDPGMVPDPAKWRTQLFVPIE